MKAAEDEAGPASDLDARPTANLEGRALTARSWRLIAVSLTTVSIAVFAVWGWLAVVHLNDRYRIDHVSGVHMALAWATSTAEPDICRFRSCSTPSPPA